MSTEWDTLAGRLEHRFMQSVGPDGRLTAWDEAGFTALALEVFAWQFERCAPYRALCERRGRTPDSVSDWRESPAVPATAFKYFDFASPPPDLAGVEPDAVFETSGTTRGAARRGRHIVPRMTLYRAAFHQPFRLALLPDQERITVLSLIPSPVEAPRSSLSCMAGMAADAFADRVEWLVSADGRWRPEARDAVAGTVKAGAPVLMLGTALAFVHLIEAFREGEILLPEGSRVMETGGFKGARRDISRSELYRGIAAHTGVPVERIVNEYGMTELLSQLYEPVLLEGADAQGRHVAPPWLQVRVLDPVTLEERRDGDEGIVSFFDLANLGSVSHLLTEDVGVMEGGRLTLLGRAPGSEPRGCSRAMDDLMASAGEAP